MTNREEIEKRFDERFGDLGKLDIYEGGIAVGYVNNNEQIKSFFLDEILPEALREIIPSLVDQSDSTLDEIISLCKNVGQN